MSLHQLLVAAAIGLPTSEELVEDHAERIEIAGCRKWLAIDLLGREVGGIQQDQRRIAQRAAFLKPPDAEIIDLEAALGEVEIIRLEVAVD